MQALEERAIYCPYCGEQITVLIEPAEEDLSYIEDCQVCCRPIEFTLSTAINGDLQVELRRDDD